MSHVPHTLADDFPDLAEQMSALRQSDRHFARLTENYHDLNREVHRAETSVAPVSDAHMIDLRKQRMLLKDEIYAYLKAQPA